MNKHLSVLPKKFENTTDTEFARRLNMMYLQTLVSYFIHKTYK